METRKVGGNNGIDVTLVGLGCNAFGRRIDQEATTKVINGALDSGVTFFDTAALSYTHLTLPTKA